MATRGAPLPIARRLEIQSMTRNMPISLVARVLGMSRNTVRKYAGGKMILDVSTIADVDARGNIVRRFEEV